ncbi:MAG: hypothetical protein IJ874_10610 [Ruminococcus sp.]|nr:hypothetical protein [Ruminococcus sp.]
MIFSYIVLSAAVLFLLTAVVCVITEPLLDRDKPAGRFFRRIRINVRETGILPYIFILLAVIIAGRFIKTTDWRLVWISAAVFLLAVMILHWFQLIHLLRSKKPAKIKKPLLLAGEAGELPLLSPAKEAAPAKLSAPAAEIIDAEPEN